MSIQITIQAGGEIESLGMKDEGVEELLPGLTDQQRVAVMEQWITDAVRRTYFSIASQDVPAKVDEFIESNVTKAS